MLCLPLLAACAADRPLRRRGRSLRHRPGGRPGADRPGPAAGHPPAGRLPEGARPATPSWSSPTGRSATRSCTRRSPTSGCPTATWSCCRTTRTRQTSSRPSGRTRWAASRQTRIADLGLHPRPPGPDRRGRGHPGAARHGPPGRRGPFLRHRHRHGQGGTLGPDARRRPAAVPGPAHPRRRDHERCRPDGRDDGAGRLQRAHHSPDRDRRHAGRGQHGRPRHPSLGVAHVAVHARRRPATSTAWCWRTATTTSVA